jgi:adenylate cyclase class 2
MQYEVENKFAAVQLARVVEQLEGLGAEFRDVIEQVDIYFAHPVRNFAETDEALRIRCIGETNLVTYKGPKIDKATKTRREIELPLATGTERVEDYSELLVALGFRKVAEVSKRRRGGRVQWNQWSVELALDEVAELGQYVELEIVVEQEQLPAAQSALLELAAHLSLPQPERRSYLEMVLAARSQ